MNKTKLSIKIGIAAALVSLIFGQEGMDGNDYGIFFTRIFILYWVILFAYEIGRQSKD